MVDLIVKIQLIFPPESACGSRLTNEDLQIAWTDGSCASTRLRLVDVSSLALGVRQGLMRLPLEQNIIAGKTAASLSLKTSWENYNLNGNAIFVSFPRRLPGIK